MLRNISGLMEDLASNKEYLEQARKERWNDLETTTKLSYNEKGKNKMANLNDIIKTGVNGETLVQGKNGGFYKILENSTVARELYVFENIAPIQKLNVQTLEKHDIIEHEGSICFVSAVSDTTVTITNFTTLTSVNMAVMQADGLDTGFIKLVNPIDFQIKNLNVKARDLLATVNANVPKLQVAVEFKNSDNMETMAKTMQMLIEMLAKQQNQ